jgi:hypothetical protein
MNEEYVCKHLLDLSKLFYGPYHAKECFAYRKGTYFYFGYENDKEIIKNRITIGVAIYLAVNKMTDNVKTNKVKRTRGK